MERETVTKFDLDAAFKALDDITFPDVSGEGRFTPNRINLRERLHAKHAHEVLVEDYFDVSVEEDLNEAQDQREAEVAKAKLARIEKIVDLDAESEEDILPSYVGKLIMQCPQCMTLFYKNEEDIEKSEETPDVVNINEICQHCGNSGGYTLVGKVGGVDESEAANFDTEDLSLEGSEDELNLDFPEEGTEEVDTEGTGEGAEEMSEEEDLDLDLDLDLEEESTEDEETNESLHNSKMLADMEKKGELKSDLESEHLTLNEEIELDEEIQEGWDEECPDGRDTPYCSTRVKPLSKGAPQWWKDQGGTDASWKAAGERDKELNRNRNPWESLEAAKLAEGYTVKYGRGGESKDFENLKDAVDHINTGMKNHDKNSYILYQDGEEMIWLDWYNSSRQDADTNWSESRSTSKSPVIFDQSKGQISMKEDIADWYRKKFDKPASSATQQAWEDELNGEMGEISDERRKHLERKFAQQRDWEARHRAPAVKPGAVPAAAAIEKEPAMAESINNSELLDKIEDKNELKTDIESEHLTLNEETDLTEAADTRIFIDQSGSWTGLKDELMAKAKADYANAEANVEFFDDIHYAGPKAAAEAGEKVVVYTDTDYKTNCPELATFDNVKIIEVTPDLLKEAVKTENTENALTEDAVDGLLDELWSGDQPTAEETEAALASFVDSEPDGEEEISEDFEDFEDFDDSFDTQVNEYLKEVYSNIKEYKSTGCSAKNKTLVVEGIISFNSGKTKKTKFVFEHAKTVNNKLVYFGLNESFSPEVKAFRMTCRAEKTKLISESFRYVYKINESLIKGSIK